MDSQIIFLHFAQDTALVCHLLWPTQLATVVKEKYISNESYFDALMGIDRN